MPTFTRDAPEQACTGRTVRVAEATVILLEGLPTAFVRTKFDVDFEESNTYDQDNERREEKKTLGTLNDCV